jgi:hypothetical protein
VDKRVGVDMLLEGSRKDAMDISTKVARHPVSKIGRRKTQYIYQDA